jgi:predicted signal transduction protein with EAL and GGDEF domain
LIRAHDMVGRWGGDEFLLVLPETGIDGARRLCEALREKIAASDLGVGEPGRVTTVTAGLALCRGGDSSDDCLQRADAALYRGKAAGRNTARPLRSRHRRPHVDGRAITRSPPRHEHTTQFDPTALAGNVVTTLLMPSARVVSALSGAELEG